MIIHIARHGQPALNGLPPGTDHEFPPGDYPLSALGLHQAELLGGFLKAEGFHGKIISSPYLRTMETASVVGSVCGLSVFMDPRFQERRFYLEPPCTGSTLEELRHRFSNIDPTAELQFPWIIPGGIEPRENVLDRVNSLLEDLLSDPSGCDVLLVGHGASVSAAMQNLGARADFTGNLGSSWNCAIGTFEVGSAGTIRLRRTLYIGYMPTEFITSNLKHWGDPE